MTQDIALVSSLIVLVGLLCQWLAWRVRLPAILFLLLAGLAAGPALGLFAPDDLFGAALMPMVSLSVAIILFEGSLTLKFSEIRGEKRVVQKLVTIGALVTWVVVAVATHLIFGFSWEISALFGAVVIVTGPTVIVPMLRTVRPSRKIANVLRWEGIAIDPVGALMAVMTYEFILASAGGAAFTHVIGLFFSTIAVGLAAGLVSGLLLEQLFRRNLLPEYLQNMAALSLVLVSFSLSNYLQHESGLLAVTVMGMWLANRPNLDIHPLLNFKEHLSILLISVLFIVLAARIDLQQLAAIGGPAILLLVVLQLIARPLKIWVSTYGEDFSWQERALLSWIAPRGIVAAAISAIFADKLVQVGYSEAAMLVPLTFSVIIGTVILQSSTSRMLARALGVAEPAPRGFLIVGANAFARELAKELHRYGIRCVLADSNWDNISAARMEGLETFYGNPVSEHADYHLDLTGIGNLLALSHQRYVNVISAIHYSADFTERNVFRLASSSDMRIAEKHSVSSSFQGGQLFGNEISYGDMLGKLSQGYRIKSTTLTDTFTWANYVGMYKGDRLPLFTVDAKGVVRPFLVGKNPSINNETTIISLAAPETAKAEIAA